jgi:hypothetical protein
MKQALPARRAARRHSRTGPPDPSGRYGLLLLVLVTSYLLSASGLSTLAADLQTVLFLGVLLLAIRTGRVSRQIARLVSAAALTGTVAALGCALTGTQAGIGTADVWKGLILLVTAVLIVRRILARPSVTVQSIYGALSAYLIIGLMFAACYTAIWRLGGGVFFAGQQTAQHQSNTQTFQYFSFTTLTTLGYGDFTAAGDLGRAIAVMEALTGQVFLATLVARLVAAFRMPAEQTRRPAGPRPRPARAARLRAGTPYRAKRPGKANRMPHRILPNGSALSARPARPARAHDRAPAPEE